MSLRPFLRHEVLLAILLAIVLVILSLQSDKFFTVSNLLNQGRLMTETGLIAIAMDRWLLLPIEQRTIERWGLVFDARKEE